MSGWIGMLSPNMVRLMRRKGAPEWVTEVEEDVDGWAFLHYEDSEARTGTSWAWRWGR